MAVPRLVVRSMGILLLGLVIPSGFAAAPDYLEPKLLTGSIYDKPGGRLLFTFSRTAVQTGEVISVLREFHSANGTLAARERVTYERDRLVRFELDEFQTGGSGRAIIESVGNDRRKINFQYVTGPAAKLKRDNETIREQALISDMLPAFLVDHWDELNRGASVKFRYIVVPRLETISFKLTRQSTGEFNGKKVAVIRMEPTSRLIAQFLDPLLFTVEADPPHRILQYWGRTTPAARAGKAWHDLDALTIFNWE